MRIPILTLALVSAAAGQHHHGSPWQSLTDGLSAWQAFGFDSNFKYVVKLDGYTLFTYPGQSPNIIPQRAFRKPDIEIQGERSGLLQQLTAPMVEYIIQGKNVLDEGGDVWRNDLIAKKAGLTLPALTKLVAQTKMNASSMWPPSNKCSNNGKWAVLCEGLEAWAAMKWDMDFSFNVGNASNSLFTQQLGKTSMQTRLPGASLSKWPAAMTISGLVADGTLSFDDKVNKHLSWWAKTGKWSEVTLRHLLTFQTGISEDADVKCAENPYADFLDCAKQLYDASENDIYTPGTHWSYLSSHLQWAGAVAVSASGLSPDQVFEKYLYRPLGMTGTTWTPKKNPQFATGITTIGDDFEKMMRKMLTYEFLGKDVLSYAERDWSAPPVSPCGDGWFGHYGMGHWFDCLGYGAGQRDGSGAALPSSCLKENIQGGPGAFGYYPLIDRNRGYYMQIVLAEDSQCRSEIPEYLRAAAKPMVDALVAGQPITDEYLFSEGGAVTLPELADIYNSIPPQCQPYSGKPSRKMHRK